MEQDVIVIPWMVDVAEKEAFEEEIVAPDGTVLMRPFGTWGDQPLVMNRKKWRLFANYVPVESHPDENRWIVRVNTTGQIVEIRDNDLAWMLRHVRVENPGATVDEVVSTELAGIVQDTGPFKNDDEMLATAFILYLGLAYAIKYGLLILVKD